jgi:hypothetical protein
MYVMEVSMSKTEVNLGFVQDLTLTYQTLCFCDESFLMKPNAVN